MAKRNFDNAETLLKVEHLCQYFKMDGSELKAVDDVNFEIKKGEVFGLVGESGCGKTTTGRSIIKLYNITGGNVFFKGIRIAAGKRGYENAIAKAKADYKAAVKEHPDQEAQLKAAMEKTVSEQKEAMKLAMEEQKSCDKEYAKQQTAAVKAKYAPLLEKATGDEKAALQSEYRNELRKARNAKLVTQIQMIFQDPIASLDPRMTVRDIIAEGLVIQGERNKQAIDDKVNEMLELVGLVREHATRYPHEFSGGQRQRIGVARSVIMNPELIIADEPVSALDVSVQAQVINLLNELREKFGLTILFIAHDLSVVKYFSDRIGVMYFGKMVEMASSDELFAHPLHPYTRSLLSAIPLPDPIYEKSRQRITYNPLAEHDYSVDKPSFREIVPGHFVQCNDEEFARYQEEMKK
ncbi:MAG: ATP-binding cassette domain-containing protein [Candidatus Faecousia sp.]|nr:ATP-binding cassette domain-containing protein [Bacillota bacterium]MDY2809611.1 ATP-binding cassette domain-containing protein [Candidatus Faecousia sp.]